jgi:hypothetical protein
MGSVARVVPSCSGLSCSLPCAILTIVTTWSTHCGQLAESGVNITKTVSDHTTRDLENSCTRNISPAARPCSCICFKTTMRNCFASPKRASQVLTCTQWPPRYVCRLPVDQKLDYSPRSVRTNLGMRLPIFGAHGLDKIVFSNHNKLSWLSSGTLLRLAGCQLEENILSFPFTFAPSCHGDFKSFCDVYQLQGDVYKVSVNVDAGLQRPYSLAWY